MKRSTVTSFVFLVFFATTAFAGILGPKSSETEATFQIQANPYCNTQTRGYFQVNPDTCELYCPLQPETCTSGVLDPDNCVCVIPTTGCNLQCEGNFQPAFDSTGACTKCICDKASVQNSCVGGQTFNEEACACIIATNAPPAPDTTTKTIALLAIGGITGGLAIYWYTRRK